MAAPAPQLSLPSSHRYDPSPRPPPLPPQSSSSALNQPHPHDASDQFEPTPLNLRFPGDDHRKPSQRMSNSTLILHAARHAEDAVVNAFYSGSGVDTGYGRHPGCSSTATGESSRSTMPSTAHTSATSRLSYPHGPNPSISPPLTPVHTYPHSQSFPFAVSSSHHGGKDARSFDQSVSIIFPHILISLDIVHFLF